MSIVEIHGGRINHRYLMNKSKSDLAHMVMDYLREWEKVNTRLAAAEQERDELRAECDRWFKVDVETRSELAAVQQENERLAGEVERLRLDRGLKRACYMNEIDVVRVDGSPKGEGLPTVITVQKGDLAGRYIPESQLTTAQQSAKEQFVAGMERAAEIADLRCISSGEHSVYEGSVEDAIREAAKEGSK